MEASKSAINAFFFFLTVAAGLTIYLFWPFLTPILLSMVLVSIFMPLKLYFQDKVGLTNYFSSLVTTLVAFLCVMVPAIIFSVALSEQALALYRDAVDSSLIDDLFNTSLGNNAIVLWIENNLDKVNIKIPTEQLVQWVSKIIQSSGLFIYNLLSNMASNIAYIVLNFLIIVVLIFTLFYSGRRLLNFLEDLSPISKEEIELLMTRFKDISWGVFVGNGIVSVLEGVLGGLAFSYFDIGPGVFWGTLIALAAFLPVIGASIVFIPAAIVLYVQQDALQMVLYLAFNLAYVTVLEMALKPKLIGDKLSLHPVVVFLTVFSGAQLFGPMGLFYGPLIITMFLTMVDLYHKFYEIKRQNN